MNATPFPRISPAFTMEDIRKIRDWSGERYTGMTRREIAEDINSGAREFTALIEKARNTKQKVRHVIPHWPGL